MTPVLHTEQLTFRPYRPEDEDHFVKEAYGMVGADNAASLAMCRRLGFRPVRDVVDATAT
ncbi:hypothetical protein [Streptomyces sp. JHA26]|uniref:hypothetical protein n=1 Tax=Streptomyces sp. JHA26 TaxID=1917143 RepID=UPI00209B6556|nr:hypothetical protein [Streptomyces sp. JHA26]